MHEHISSRRGFSGMSSKAVLLPRASWSAGAIRLFPAELHSEEKAPLPLVNLIRFSVTTERHKKTRETPPDTSNEKVNSRVKTLLTGCGLQGRVLLWLTAPLKAHQIFLDGCAPASSNALRRGLRATAASSSAQYNPSTKHLFLSLYLSRRGSIYT